MSASEGSEPSAVAGRPGRLRLVLSTLGAVVVTGVCLRLLLTRETLRALGDVLPRVDPLVLGLVLPLVVGVTLVRAARFSLLLGVRGPGATASLLRVCALQAFLNLMLPFKVGEASFPVLARRSFGTPYGTGIGALLYVRVTDLLLLIAIGGGVLSAIGRGSSPLERFALPAALTALVLLSLLPALVTRVHALGRTVIGSPRMLELLDRLGDGCRAVATPRRHAAYVALSVCAWALIATCACVTMGAMGAMGARPNVLHAMLACAGASLTFALPVSGVAGVGPMQASWAYALTLVGWGWELALANAFLYHATMVACSAVLALVASAMRVRRVA